MNYMHFFLPQDSRNLGLALVRRIQVDYVQGPKTPNCGTAAPLQLLIRNLPDQRFGSVTDT